MIGAYDPVGIGLIAGLARPGGNVTGLSFGVGMETVSKGLELLKETVPKVRRVAILSNPANPAHALAIREVEVAARSAGADGLVFESMGLDEQEAYYQQAKKGLKR